MELKLIGALMLIAGCTGAGFTAAAVHRKEIHTITQLLNVVSYMECELQYHLTAMPALCRQASQMCNGIIKKLLKLFSAELENQISADASICLNIAIDKCGDLTPLAKECVEKLGQSLGMFDLQGQLLSLSYAKRLCEDKLKQLKNNEEVRLRSYKALGLCAGAALAILLF